MRLATAPLWVWALLQGSLGTVVCLSIGSNGGLTEERVGLAFAVGAVLGPLAGWGAWRRSRRERADLFAAVPELHGLGPSEREAAERAAVRGPVPPDPAVRLVAAEVARYRLVRSIEQRATGVVAAVLVAALMVMYAVVGSQLAAWLAAAVFLGLGVDAVLAPRRRSTRVVVLEDGAPALADA